MERIRIAIVDDDHRFLEGVSTLLADEPCIEIVGAYITGKAAVTGIVAQAPDVALVDLGLPDIQGDEVIRRIRQKGCPTEALVLTSYEGEQSLFAALQAGATGYIMKSEARREKIVWAIQEVKSGGAPMSDGIARRVLTAFRTTPRAAANPRLQALTPRELEILKHCRQGLSARKIAQLLYISYETVRCHQKTIYNKLQVHSAVEAAAVSRGEHS